MLIAIAIALLFVVNALLVAWLAFGRYAKRSLRDGYFQIPFKGGWNDLRRWKSFGGTLDRPPPPAPINTARPASSES